MGCVWNLVVKHLEEGQVNTVYTRKEAAKVDIESLLLVSLSTAIHNKKLCYDKYQTLKPNATIYRKRFLHKSQRDTHNNEIKGKQLR